MSGGRLPSFKGPRDLSLGTAGGLGARSKNPLAKSKGLLASSSSSGSAAPKKFVPNLKVQRRTDSQQSDLKVDQIKKEESSSGWKKHHHHKDSPTKVKYNKPRTELIQTMGSVFSEGLNSEMGIRRRGFGGSGSAAGGESSSCSKLDRPKMNLNAKFDKEGDEKRLKDLLRDDFVDDLKTGNLVPVQLPMVDTGKVFKAEEDSKEDVKIEVKKMTKKKNVILDSDDDDEDEIKEETKPQQQQQEDSSVISKTTTFPDLVKTQKGDLLFVQLPDHLPGHVQEIKQEDSASDDVTTATIKNTTNCTLSSLPEGYVGKLQIRKSGRTQLLIGETLLDVDMGTQVGFLQELFAIQTLDVNEEEDAAAGDVVMTSGGHMTSLGRVDHRVVVTPCWSQLFHSKQNMDSSDSSCDEDEQDKMDV